MNSALSRHDRGPAGLCLLTVALVVGTILATFGPGVAEAWPLSSAPRYECYCRNCYEGHFVCRNRNYSCNCAVCSCYNDVVQLAADTHTPRDKDGNDDDDDDHNNNNNGQRFHSKSDCCVK